MIKVSATKLRHDLFTYLDRVADGESIIIQHRNREIARLVPTSAGDWREKMTFSPQLCVSPEEFIKPLDDLWADYQ